MLPQIVAGHEVELRQLSHIRAMRIRTSRLQRNPSRQADKVGEQHLDGAVCCMFSFVGDHRQERAGRVVQALDAPSGVLVPVCGAVTGVPQLWVAGIQVGRKSGQRRDLLLGRGRQLHTYNKSRTSNGKNGHWTSAIPGNINSLSACGRKINGLVCISYTPQGSIRGK